jgi:hypothetical protein
VLAARCEWVDEKVDGERLFGASQIVGACYLNKHPTIFDDVGHEMRQVDEVTADDPSDSSNFV